MRSLTIVEFLAHIQDLPPETMYRGHGDSSWALTPSLARYADSIEGYSHINELEEHLIEDFLRYSVPHHDIRKLPRIEQLIHCQHFGLPTRLLDWSTNPLKALFFAVENPTLDHRDACVHVFSPNAWWQGTGSLKELDSLTAFFPELLNERVSSQDGCFVCFPLPKSGMHVRELTRRNYPKDFEHFFKIVVPKRQKRFLRQELAVLGVTHRTIYPGLEGVAKWVRSSLSQFRL